MDATDNRQGTGRGWFRRRGTAEPVASPPDGASLRGALPALEAMTQLLQTREATPELIEQLAEQARLAMDADVVLVRRLLRAQHSLLTETAVGVVPVQLAGLRGAVVPAPPGFEEVVPGTFAMVDLSGEVPGAYLGRTDANELAELGIEHVLVLPLSVRGTVVGRLDFGRRVALPFTLEKRAVAPVIAYLIADALAGARGIEGERQAKALRARAAAVESVDPSGGVEETVVRLGEIARALTSADLVLVLRWQPEAGAFVPVGLAGGAPYLLEAVRAVPLRPAVVPALQIVAQHLEPVVVPSDDIVHALGPGLVQQFGVRSAVLTPLRDAQGRLHGALLALATGVEAQLGQEEVAVLGELARASAHALSLAAQLDELRAALERRQLVEELARRLVMAADEAEVVRRACEGLHALLDTSTCLLGVVGEVRDRIVWYGRAAGSAVGPVDGRLGDDAVGRAVRAQVPIRLTQPDTLDVSRWLPAELSVPSAQSALVVPVTTDGRTLGVLVLASAQPDAYRPAHEKLALDVAGWIAQALAQLQSLRTAREAGERRASLLGQLLSRQEAERKRLVDAVHNRTLQGLATCLYRLELTARRAEQQPIETTVSELHQVRDLLAQQVAELRETVFRLRPATLDHLGLEAALREYLHHLKRVAGVEAALDSELPERLPPELETTVYRIVQEAIDTVRLKAGITRALVRIRQRPDRMVVVTIADDGREDGAERAVAGDERRTPDLGLLALRERIALAGGAMRFIGLPQGGTVMQIMLPRRDGQ